MTNRIKRFVERLDAVAPTGDDPEAAHGDADNILLEAVHPEIRDAYERLMDRCDGFWYA